MGNILFLENIDLALSLQDEITLTLSGEKPKIMKQVDWELLDDKP